MADSKLLKDICKQIKDIADRLGVEPYQLNKAQFKEFSQVSEWDLKKLGGYQTILTTYFPGPEKDLKSIVSTKEQKSYITKLEKTYGRLDLFQERISKMIQAQLGTIKIEPLILDKKATERHLASLHGDTGKHSISRSVVALASDLHFGSVVDEEVGGINQYNFEIAARRWALFIKQIADYKIEARGSHEELHLILLGDLIQGVIHDYDSPNCALMGNQVGCLTEYLIAGIDYLQPFFNRITVSCTAGNHGRRTYKQSHDRAMINRSDSHEHDVFKFLGIHYRNNQKITVNVPVTPWIELSIQNHRLWASHGDVLVSLPNPSKNLSTEKLETKLNKINASEREKGKKPFDIFCFGHIHQPAHIMTTAGSHVIINGCLVGVDQFALNMGCAFTSVPTQTIFEISEKYGTADIRLVYVDKADNNKALESIIKPYKGELV